MDPFANSKLPVHPVKEPKAGAPAHSLKPNELPTVDDNRLNEGGFDLSHFCLKLPCHRPGLRVSLLNCAVLSKYVCDGIVCVFDRFVQRCSAFDCLLVDVGTVADQHFRCA